MSAPLSLKELLALRQVDAQLQEITARQIAANKEAARKLLLRMKADLDSTNCNVTLTIPTRIIT